MPLLRKLSLITTILGILALFLILNLSSPIEVNSPEQLSKLTPNQKVTTTGEVISERVLYAQTKLIKLNNSIELVCDSCPACKNKTIQAIGTAEQYENKTQISVSKIKIEK